MYVLGLSGGPATIAQQSIHMNAEDLSHDGAAVLIKDGQVVAAVEEERLNRIKHSNLFPVEGAAYCLRRAGIGIDEVDAIAFYLNEAYLDYMLSAHFARQGITALAPRARDLLGQRLAQVFGKDVRDKLVFVDHHLTHAYSAFPYSPGAASLVLIMDGAGEYTSGLIGRAENGSFTKLQQLSFAQSLGSFYLSTIKFMGLKMFDEYKAMGLAPYGNPAVYRALFQELYWLKPGGDFDIMGKDKLGALLARAVPVAPDSEQLLQCHRDLAAALQEALETIVMHILANWRQVTGLEHLCLAGGVAHNCTMNGKILHSGLFKSVFVQPAAHDAGCALGAANYVALQRDPALQIAPLTHVYWGPELAGPDELARLFARWADWIELERTDDIVGVSAQRLAAGEVIGWVQGASEFGPRALGNRSILSDPRPAANRARINRMIKKREGFRPFAPSVTEEAASRYFEMGPAASLPFMSHVIEVKPEYRAQLGAITHVDGTARVQTVSREANPRYWQLLCAVGTLSGIPMLLNTSFNNNVEPIVDSAEDALACFLTTELDRLVVGDFSISKRARPVAEQLAGAGVRLVPHAALQAARIDPASGQLSSAGVASALSGRQHALSAASLASVQSGTVTDDPQVCQDILILWEKRLVNIVPARTA